MSAAKYVVNEVFYSLQGEGARAGSANVFVRFTGCNLRCDVAPGELSPGGFACDTEFASGRAMTTEELLAEVLGLMPKAGAGVIFTGGEPTVQLLPKPDIVKELLCRGIYTAIETNGTADVSPLYLDWITLSPKVAEHAVKVRGCSEVKYVRAHGQAIPLPSVEAQYHYISPAATGDRIERRDLDWCIELVKANPLWRLSVQQHKAWRAR